MEKVINKYETIFIINAALTEEEIKVLVEKFTTLISTNGTIESVEEWGKKKLAYLIDDLSEGYYVLVNFSSEPDFPAELDRVYKITDGLIRSIIVKKEQ